MCLCIQHPLLKVNRVARAKQQPQVLWGPGVWDHCVCLTRHNTHENATLQHTLSVSAKKKLCIWSSCSGGSTVTSLIPVYPASVLQCCSVASKIFHPHSLYLRSPVRRYKYHKLSMVSGRSRLNLRSATISPSAVPLSHTSSGANPVVLGCCRSVVLRGVGWVSCCIVRDCIARCEHTGGHAWGMCTSVMSLTKSYSACQCALGMWTDVYPHISPLTYQWAFVGTFANTYTSGPWQLLYIVQHAAPPQPLS